MYMHGPRKAAKHLSVKCKKKPHIYGNFETLFVNSHPFRFSILILAFFIILFSKIPFGPGGVLSQCTSPLSTNSVFEVFLHSHPPPPF